MARTYAPRKYLPIWKKIKADKKCVISAHPKLFARIVKAVMKEKDQDVAMKIANDLDKLYLKITRDEQNHTVTFELKQRVGISEIVVVG